MLSASKGLAWKFPALRHLARCARICKQNSYGEMKPYLAQNLPCFHISCSTSADVLMVSNMVACLGIQLHCQCMMGGVHIGKSKPRPGSMKTGKTCRGLQIWQNLQNFSGLFRSCIEANFCK